MACRRVAIQRIKAEIPKDETTTTTTTTTSPDPNRNQNVLTGQTQSIKPEPKITVEQKIKEGISKKILRFFFMKFNFYCLN